LGLGSENDGHLIIIVRLFTYYLTDTLAVRTFEGQPVKLIACFQTAAKAMETTRARHWQLALVIATDAPDSLAGFVFGGHVPAKSYVLLEDLFEGGHLLEPMDLALCFIHHVLAQAIVRIWGGAVDNVDSSNQVLKEEIGGTKCSNKV
jgi:hypothetical protein